MTQTFASFAATGMLALSLSACATAQTTKVEVVADAPKGLSAEAQQALSGAEAAINKAKAEFALWVPADNAFKSAQEAAKAGDSAEVLKQSRIASELAALGLAQNNYPSTEMK